MSELDERAHVAVLAPMLDATLGPDPDTGAATRVFEYGKVPGADGNPGQLPRIYVLVSIERRFAQPRQANMTNRSGWRISLRYVGHTVDEARWAALQITNALNQRQITVGGAFSTAITHEQTRTVEPDDGLYSGRSDWTYAL